MKNKAMLYLLAIVFALGVIVGAALFVLMQGYILIVAAFALFAIVAKIPRGAGFVKNQNKGG